MARVKEVKESSFLKNWDINSGVKWVYILIFGDLVASGFWEHYVIMQQREYKIMLYKATKPGG